MNNKSLKNFQAIRLAWSITGGSKALVRSGDFWLAIAISVLCYGTWSEPKWWDQPISILPNLLGFTLGGFAIFLGFGSDNFTELIADEEEQSSIYLSVSAAFLMFVVTQCAALLFALVAAGVWRPVPHWLGPIGPILVACAPLVWGLGYFLFIYGIVLAVRAALRIFRVSRWYNAFIVAEQKRKAKAKAEAETQAQGHADESTRRHGDGQQE